MEAIDFVEANDGIHVFSRNQIFAADMDSFDLTSVHRFASSIQVNSGKFMPYHDEENNILNVLVENACYGDGICDTFFTVVNYDLNTSKVTVRTLDDLPLRGSYLDIQVNNGQIELIGYEGDVIREVEF